MTAPRFPLFALACAATFAFGCGSDGDAPSTRCAGSGVVQAGDRFCAIHASTILGRNVRAEGLVSVIDDDGTPRPWFDASLWDGFDPQAACAAQGFPAGDTFGVMLVCGPHLNWSSELEGALAALIAADAGATAAPSAVADWAATCDDWCQADCGFGGTRTECLGACVQGLAERAGEDGAACAAAQLDLTGCEGASSCADDATCASQRDTAALACWLCAGDDACPLSTFCVDGTCAHPAQCGDVTCAATERCVDGVCAEVDPCADVSCEDDEVCEEGTCVAVDACAAIGCPADQRCAAGACVPNDGACSEDDAFADDWTIDRVDDVFQARFPDGFTPDRGAFVGDDTTGFNKTSGDDAIVFQIEVGPGTPADVGTFAELPAAGTLGYNERALFTGAFDCTLGALYTRTAPGEARPNVGRVLAWDVHAAAYRHVVDVSFATDASGLVSEIVRTIERAP